LSPLFYMKIGVLIPTRGDRPKFLEHALFLISEQTHKPHFIEVVDDIPFSSQKDITYRYRVGCDRLVNKGCEIIFFWEDDDFYSPSYIQNMLDYWVTVGRPKIFGINHSIYYHLKLQKWFRQDHPGRASAMNTMVTSSIINYSWPKDNEPFTDLHLWKDIPGRSVDIPVIKSIGIKHGIGLCGGKGHSSLHWYKNNDPGFKWLSKIVDKRSLEFYKDVANNRI
jgi:hypothetical protein